MAVRAVIGEPFSTCFSYYFDDYQADQAPATHEPAAKSLKIGVNF